MEQVLVGHNIVVATGTGSGKSFAFGLPAQCESDLEREVLRAIRERGLPLPDAAQKTLYADDEPIAIADFFYAPRIVVFVDGSPHYRDYVPETDRRKRNWLKGSYRVTVVRGAHLAEDLAALAAKLTK